MKALLYLAELPTDVEVQKALDPSLPISGGSVVPGEMAKAIVRYSEFARIGFPRRLMSPNGDLRESDLFKQHQSRLRFLNASELNTAIKSVPTVLASTGWGMENLANLRPKTARPRVPITGVIHSLCSPMILPTLAQLFLSPFTPHDALVCTSVAGRRTVRMMLDDIFERFEASGIKIRCNIQLPIIPLGIDLESWQVATPARSGKSVLYFGRFSNTSKADLIPLLIAWKTVHSAVPDAVLTIAGDDRHAQLASEFRNIIRELNLGTSVEVIADPGTSLKRSLFATASIMVSPSDNLQETFGLTILEGMSAELAVVASDWSGYRDLVVNGITGILVPTCLPVSPKFMDERAPLSDNYAPFTAVDVRHLTTSLIELLRSPDLAMRMGRAGRLRVQEQYSWPVVIKAYDQLWMDLLDRCRDTDEGSTWSLTEWDPSRLFGHFATQLLKPTSTARLSSDATGNLDLCTRDRRSAAAAYLLVVDSLSQGPKQIETLVSQLVSANRSLSTEDALMIVGRLLKYDVLSVY